MNHLKMAKKEWKNELVKKWNGKKFMRTLRVFLKFNFLPISSILTHSTEIVNKWMTLSVCISFPIWSLNNLEYCITPCSISFFLLLKCSSAFKCAKEANSHNEYLTIHTQEPSTLNKLDNLREKIYNLADKLFIYHIRNSNRMEMATKKERPN